jgi:hypothetical protein
MLPAYATGTIPGRVIPQSNSSILPDTRDVLPSSSHYDRCNESSWRDMQLEWYGPFSALDECVLACQAYFELGGREGAERVAMRRDLLDLLM